LVALVTATVPCDSPAVGQRVLISSFADLRRTAGWRRVVAGGAAFVQVVPAAARGARSWNVHLHALVEVRIDATVIPDVDWMDPWSRQLFGGQQLLFPWLVASAGLSADGWRRLVQKHSRSLLTGNLHVLLVEGLWPSGAGPGVSRVAQYVTRRKRFELLDYNDDQIVEVVSFLRRRRLASFFGAWRSQP
jgi:hypothetical protein